MGISSQSSGLEISVAQAAITGLEINTAASVLYCYEWLLTLDQEIQHIWARKWNLSTWIFAVNRYAALLTVVEALAQAHDHRSCTWILRVHAVFELLQFLALAVFTGLRASALCDRSLLVFTGVFALSVVPFFTNMVIFIKEVPTFTPAVPNNLCNALPPFTDATELRVTLSTRVAVITGDIIVLIVTWRRALRTMREAPYVKNVTRMPLNEVLVRDGTMFFVGLLAASVFMLLADNVPFLTNLEPANNFLTPLTAIIMSRFMLNLRQASERSGQSLHDWTHFSTIRFNPNLIMGNMGESLRFGNQEEDDAWDTTEENPDYDSEAEKRGIVELENGISQSYALPREGVVTRSGITEIPCMQS